MNLNSTTTPAAVTETTVELVPLEGAASRKRLDLGQLRRSLGETKGQQYWRSLDE